MLKGKRYWFCIIGPVKLSDIPTGGDFPMRDVVSKKFQAMFGSEPKHFYSGWGVNESLMKMVMKILS